ncbi:MAG: transposase [Gammaproteobacteria bacterium]|nr:transposase [Gammaproteobacteria bacterium]
MDSHSMEQAKRETGKTSDPDADLGMHKKVSMDGQRKKRAKSNIWFGYRLHLIADTVYELPVSFEITPASFSEQKVLPQMITEIFDQDTGLNKRCKEFSADHGLGRINGRLDNDFGFERYYLSGLKRM